MLASFKVEKSRRKFERKSGGGRGSGRIKGRELCYHAFKRMSSKHPLP